MLSLSSDTPYALSEQNPIDQPTIEKQVEERSVFVISKPNAIWVIFTFIVKVIKNHAPWKLCWQKLSKMAVLASGFMVTCTYRQAQLAKGNCCKKYANKINLTKNLLNIILGFALKGLSIGETKEGITVHWFCSKLMQTFVTWIAYLVGGVKVFFCFPICVDGFVIFFCDAVWEKALEGDAVQRPGVNLQVFLIIL